MEGCRGVPGEALLNWRLKTLVVGLARHRHAAVASEESADLVMESMVMVLKGFAGKIGETCNAIDQ